MTKSVAKALILKRWQGTVNVIMQICGNDVNVIEGCTVILLY